MDFFPDDLNDSIESLPASLKDSLTKIQELDKSLLEIQQQNEQRCEQEIEEIKRKIESGEIKPGTLRNRKSRFSGSGAGLSRFRFSDQTFDEQKLCINIADQKVALATEAYDLVDERIRKLDQFMRNIIVVRQDGALDDDRITRSGRASKSRTEGDKELTVTAEPQPHMILDLPVDLNEPTFCICNEVSWGKMIACDNPHCKIEWFHFSCVEVTEQPKGKWYCPSCRPDCIVLERRKGK